jgi:vancomycin resistance protein YoaR
MVNRQGKVMHYNRTLMENTVHPDPIKRTNWLAYTVLAISIGFVLAAMVFLSLILAFEIKHRDQIYTGVYMAGIDLSGMTLDETEAALSGKINYQSNGKILLVDGTRSWLASPAELGFYLDIEGSARQAFQVGREYGVPKNLTRQFQAWDKGIDVSPIAIYDQRKAHAYLQSIAQQVDIPVIEANLSLDGAQVVVNSGQVGRKLDIESTLIALNTPLVSMKDEIINLVINETSPVIMDVAETANLAQNILNAPLTLSLPSNYSDAGPWTISQSDLANLLVIKRNESDDKSGYTIGVNRNLLQAYLSSLSLTLKIYPVNARFRFNDDTRKLDLVQSATIGRELNITASLDEIEKRIMEGEHSIALVMTVIEPVAKDTTTGEELGITELIHSETSYFYGSASARVQNIDIARKQFDGLLIPPHTTFSMADALGNISLENGYAEALIIVGDQTVQGVGGGVCQVSTTLFRAAFFAGYPINERHAHAYRVGYYEMKRDGSRDSNLAGLDATVYVPIVDFKFTNDSDHWLLMETYLGNYESLTWKFYSTSDNRTVQWETTGPTNIVKAPPPVCRLNPELAEGEIKKVDYAADGAYIQVNRDVFRNGAFYFEDSFVTQFQPWQEAYEYGPGTTDLPCNTP